MVKSTSMVFKGTPSVHSIDIFVSKLAVEASLDMTKKLLPITAFKNNSEQAEENWC